MSSLEENIQIKPQSQEVPQEENPNQQQTPQNITQDTQIQHESMNLNEDDKSPQFGEISPQESAGNGAEEIVEIPPDQQGGSGDQQGGSAGGVVGDMSMLVAALAGQSAEFKEPPLRKIATAYDSPDLVVAVLNPGKRAGRNKLGVSNYYMSYEVKTLTTLPEYGFAERSVRRRFSDFVTLHSVLRRQFPGCFIPALPEKNYMEGKRMSEDFIKIRTADLNKYVRQAAAHPELRRSAELVKFLSVESELAHSFEWSTLVSSPYQTQQQMESGSKGFVDYMKMVKDISVGSLTKSQPTTPSETEEKWKQTQLNMIEREKDYAIASKSAEGIIKALDEMGTELGEFGAICVQFARFEEEQGEQHGLFSLAGRYSTKRAADFQRMGYGMLKMGPVYKRQALMTASKLITIHDELAFLPEVFQGLQEREATYTALDSLKHEIQNREAKSASGSPNMVSVKAVQQQKELENMKSQAEIAEMQYKRLLERNETELTRYDKIRNEDLADMLEGYVELQMEFSQLLVTTWNAIAQQYLDNMKLSGNEN